MEYKDNKDLEDYINSLYKIDKYKYYELLLLKELNDKLSLFEDSNKKPFINKDC